VKIFFKLMNLWQSYKQECGCLMHFVCLPTLLKVEEDARHNPPFCPELCRIFTRLSNKPFLISLLKIPPHLKYVTTVPSNIHVSLITALVHNCRSFSDIIVSQGNVATHMRCSGIFNKHFAANLLENLKVKFFLENCLRINRVTAISLVSPFFGTRRKSVTQ